MKRLLCIVFLASATAPAADLQSQLQHMAAQHHGKVALYAKNLQTGATVALDSDRPVKTASLIKLPVMLEAMYQVKAGKRRLADKIKLTKDDQVLGSGILSLMRPGLELTLEDAITLMIVLSDNTATNLVIDQVSIAAVNARVAGMGLKNTCLYKKVYKPAEGPLPPDQKQFGLGKTTAREMAEVMAAIQRCDLADRPLCDRMLEMLRNQFYRNAIPRYIETADTSETKSAVANKTGALDQVRNDVAVVSSSSGPIVISVFTYANEDQRWTPENQAEVLIGRMARAIVDAWAPQPAKP